MDVTGRPWGGSSSPPLGTHQSLYVHDDDVTRVFSMIDDGGFVGIGYPTEWQVIMRTKAARMFAWWTFKLLVGDWFGLRSWLYYTALHRSVRGGRWKLRLPYGKRTRALTRLSSYDEWVLSPEAREARTPSKPVQCPAETQRHSASFQCALRSHPTEFDHMADTPFGLIRWKD